MKAINKPDLPPEQGYIEIECNGEREYKQLHSDVEKLRAVINQLHNELSVIAGEVINNE